MRRGPLIVLWCGAVGAFTSVHACTYDWPVEETPGAGGNDGSVGGSSGAGGTGGAVGGNGGNAGDGGGVGGVAGGGAGGSTAGVTPSGLEVSADGNGVIELAEQAQVKPSWTLTSGATLAETGTLTSGTPTRVTLGDDSATYALTQSDSVACTDCYAVTPKTRPTGLLHWDLSVDETLGVSGAQHSWLLHIGPSFSDVTTSSAGYLEIETLLHMGYDTVVDFCPQTGAFCPGSGVRRDELSVWVALAIAGKAPIPASVTIGGSKYDCQSTPYFSDVPASNPACKHIHYLASLGIVGGTTPTDAGLPTFNASSISNRGGTAAFVAKAFAYVESGNANIATIGPGYNCETGANPYSDVADGTQFCAVVGYLSNALGSADVSCGSGTFCPMSDTTRAIAATWLVRMLDVPLYGL